MYRLTCISHHPTVEAREKAVIRVSCLVIREKHGQGIWFAPEEMTNGR